ncbi:MAG: hypothetical protein GY696_22930, partial [Gammaproteobacteria bacterium]|nr:hypothetical protein [Gammaproteobacteria bacterium]
MHEKTKNLERKQSESQEEISELRREIKNLKPARSSDNGATAIQSGTMPSLTQVARQLSIANNPAAIDLELIQRVLNRDPKLDLRQFKPVDSGAPEPETEELLLTTAQGGEFRFHTGKKGSIESITQLRGALSNFFLVLVAAGFMENHQMQDYIEFLVAWRHAGVDQLSEFHRKFRVWLIRKDSFAYENPAAAPQL